ncbi:MAG: hypothetical protein IJF84_02040 [Thermoguttaceae bacterium]|nr:hypothetical protein [Thermoguttaceae bacterium]
MTAILEELIVFSIIAIASDWAAFCYLPNASPAEPDEEKPALSAPSARVPRSMLATFRYNANA